MRKMNYYYSSGKDSDGAHHSGPLQFIFLWRMKMEYIKAMRICNRMCNTMQKTDCLKCKKCELSSINNSKNMGCNDFMRHYPEIAELILEKWNKENPEKTFADDFFEKHPNAEKDLNNIPHVCALKCGYVKECRTDRRCDKCWTQSLEE